MPFFGLAINFIVQVAMCRLRLAGLFLSHVIALAAGAGAILATWNLPAQTPDGMAANLLIYLLFSYVYFQVNHMGQTARRVRLARDLEPGALTRAEILARYDAKEIIDHRIDRLIAAGQIAEKNGRLYLNGSAIYSISVLINLLKELIFPAYRNDVRTRGEDA